MSQQASVTEVEKNTVDKEKSPDKAESLKRPASEVTDGKDDSKQKQQKTGKDDKPNGFHKPDDEEDADSILSEEDVGGEGEDFDEEEGDEDAGDEDGEEDDEEDA